MTWTDFPYNLVDRWLETLPGIRVLSPLDQSDEDRESIFQFRRQQIIESAPYLEAEIQRENEVRLKLDERSLHFAIKHNGLIVACVRATPPPFELATLSKELGTLAHQYSNYYEFGRLFTDPGLELRSKYARILVVKAAQVLFQNEIASGILGICRKDRVPYMKRLGLESDPNPVRVEERDGEYYFIHASKDRLLAYHFSHLLAQFADASPLNTLPPQKDVTL